MSGEVLSVEEGLKGSHIHGIRLCQGRYISFRYAEPSKSGKTHVWNVVAEDGGSALGQVRYFGRWNQYAFWPARGTIFEKVCLREIAQFCQNQTSAQRRDR